MSEGLSMQAVWDLLDDTTEKLGYHTDLRGTWCCSSCSQAALADQEDDFEFALYFHEQDVEGILQGDERLALRHCPSDDDCTKEKWGEYVKKFIELAGDCVEWDGDIGTVIWLKVDPSDWEWRDNFPQFDEEKEES